MSLFGQARDMYKLQQQAKKIKKELAKTHIFSEQNGIKVTVNGNQEIVSYEIVDTAVLQDARNLEKSLLEASNKALKKAQQVAAEQMKEMMGGMQGMSEMLGGK